MLHIYSTLHLALLSCMFRPCGALIRDDNWCLEFWLVFSTMDALSYSVCHPQIETDWQLDKMHSGRSLVNNSGPRMPPCGTPDITGYSMFFLSLDCHGDVTDRRNTIKLNAFTVKGRMVVLLKSKQVSCI